MVSVIEVNESEDVFELSHFIHCILPMSSKGVLQLFFFRLMGIKIIVGIFKIFTGLYMSVCICFLKV